MRRNRCYPLCMFLVCKICILVPIAIYASDIIVGVKVLASSDLGMELVIHKENRFKNPETAPLFTLMDHPYRHEIPKSVLSLVCFFFVSLDISALTVSIKSVQLVAKRLGFCRIIGKPSNKDFNCMRSFPRQALGTTGSAKSFLKPICP